VKIISFAWTTPALLAGKKTVTRRDWNPRYAATFRSGELVAAYDRQPRYRGKQVAVIRLTATPTLESTADAPEGDYAAEGFEYLAELGAKIDGLSAPALWRVWHWKPRDMWVVRFELVQITTHQYCMAHGKIAKDVRRQARLL
jgi:hypothetical protein